MVTEGDLMSTAGKALVVVAGAILLAGCSSAAQPVAVAQDAPPPVVVQDVAEDDPAWNCYTMGNGSCGDIPTLELPGVMVAIPEPANDGVIYASFSTGEVQPVAVSKGAVTIALPGGGVYVVTDAPLAAKIRDYVG